MDDAMDESRQDRPKDRGAEEKRQERDATERRFEKEERAPRRNRYHEKRSSQERVGVGDRKEKEREYKRRKSASPPPVNKDWRHSPPSRRSPPYKRRREVNFEGNRRRSFGDEGGRRFANDNRTGGFDGARLYLTKKLEDQNKLDCANFQGFNMHSYTSIYGDSHISQNMCKETLMTYKQFILELEDDISPKEAQCRYEAYNKEYVITKKQAYFKKHKDDDWLRERYDPTRLEALLIRRNESAKIQAKEFLSKLQACSLCLGPNTQSLTKEECDSDMDCGIKRRKLSQAHSFPQDHKGSLLAHSQCSNPKRILNDINLERSLVKKLDGEKGIEANILLVHKDAHVDMIDGSPLVIPKSCKHVKELQGVELLEIMRIYLWRVHFVDYYGMMEYKEKPKKIRLKTSQKIKINGSGIEDPIFAKWKKELETTWQIRLQTSGLIESMFGKEALQTATNDALDPFVRKIRDEKYGWKYGCAVKGCTKLFHGAEFVHKHLKLKHSNLVTEVVRKAQEELYFQNYMRDADAPGANHKTSMHMRHAHKSNDKSKNNHRQSFSKTSTRCIDKQELISKPTSNAKLHPPIDIKCTPHTNEECTSILDNEHFNCNGQRERPQLDTLEACEHSQLPQLFPWLGNARPYHSQRRHLGSGFEHFPTDPFMFDRFNGPSLQGLPSDVFIPNISCPPRVLIPVPGAGPLGPFIPAPPRIATRFLVEGPDPFHNGFEQEVLNNNNRQFRNFKSPTPSPLIESGLLNVSSLMIPPQILHQDPRSIRSYHDLDKLEDEATVIDYRSL